MTPDDYHMLRAQYPDLDALCRSVESAAPGDERDARLRDLVTLLLGQQREPSQVRSLLRHLGMDEEAARRALGRVG